MRNILREYIRELLTSFLVEKNTVSEPDEKTGEHQLETSALGGMSITGVTSPLSSDPDEKAEDDEINSRAFGGGTFKE